MHCCCFGSFLRGSRTGVDRELGNRLGYVRQCAEMHQAFGNLREVRVEEIQQHSVALRMPAVVLKFGENVLVRIASDEQTICRDDAAGALSSCGAVDECRMASVVSDGQGGDGACDVLGVASAVAAHREAIADQAKVSNRDLFGVLIGVARVVVREVDDHRDVILSERVLHQCSVQLATAIDLAGFDNSKSLGNKAVADVLYHRSAQRSEAD